MSARLHFDRDGVLHARTPARTYARTHAPVAKPSPSADRDDDGTVQL